MNRVNWNLNEAISMFKLIKGMIWAQGLFSIYINCVIFVNSISFFFCKYTWLRDIAQTNKILKCKKATTFQSCMDMVLQLFAGWSSFTYCELLLPILCEHPANNDIYRRVHVLSLLCMNGKVTLGKASFFCILSNWGTIYTSKSKLTK